jgi:hypothetical protein
MKKRLFGLTVSAFIFAAALAGCGSKGDISELKGTYNVTGYGSWGGDKYPDCKTLEASLKNVPMKISNSGKMTFYGNEYQLVPEGTQGDILIYGVKGSGFDFDSRNEIGFDVDSDYEGPAYFSKQSQSMTVNDKEYTYDTYVVYYTAKGDKSCSAYFSFDNGSNALVIE